MTMSVPCLIYVVVIMFIVYRAVLHIERQAEKFRFVPRFQKAKAKKDRDRSSRLMKQAIKYSLALIIVWTPMVIFFITWQTSGPHYFAYILNAVLLPTQGENVLYREYMDTLF